MLCGVTATLGSNPSATATAARPHWGRAVLLCLGDVLCCCVAPRVFRAPEAPTMGPGCFVCPWAAARPRAVRAARRPCCVLLLVAPLVFWAPEVPAAREIATRELRSEWSISKPARALRSLRRPPHRWCCVAGVWLGASSRSTARPRRCPSISHVIPLRLIQTLNLHRWNCNVFAWSRKKTTINYVRLLVSAGSAAAFGCWGRTLRPFLRSSSLRRWGFCTT